jgi:hypothetical protein
MRLIATLIAIVGTTAGISAYNSQEQPRKLGGVETVTEANSGLPFAARVDTGARTCSIHYEAIKIENESKDPLQNLGKKVRILVKNRKGQSKWVEAKIAEYVVVRTSERSSGRYKVRLPLVCQNVQKEVLVTLNNRQHMRYPLLIGRNFLREDFVVAVD